ncbi:hypothetical protein QJQ45_023974 [Haematococcus lacustris]|nr:hypothetical protein QJQ45_023974 [Haematococcus lacustris]
MLKEACKQFPGRVLMVHEFRTSRVSSARTNVVAGHAEGFRWLRPVRSMATRSRIRGLMCSTSTGIRFYDRDVSAALNIRRIAAGPGRPRELSSWVGRPAMPNPGRPGQEWVCVRDRGLRCASSTPKRRGRPTSYTKAAMQAPSPVLTDLQPTAATAAGPAGDQAAAGRLVIRRARSEVVEARLVTQIEAWVEACSKRALLASLLLGLMVRDSFTRVTALADGQELLEEIPAEDAVIPDFAERNLFLQLGRGLPPPELHSRPSAAVEDVLTAYPTLSDELNVVPRYPHDCNTVDDVGQKLETSFANSLTELFKRRVGQAVALAGARVIAGSHEHQRRFGLPVDGSPAWTERQRSWVVRSVRGKVVTWLEGQGQGGVVPTEAMRYEVARQRRLLGVGQGVVVNKAWRGRNVNRGSLLRHAVDTSRQLEAAHVSWQADWANWQVLGGQPNSRPYRPPSPFAITPGCGCKAHHIQLDTRAIYGLMRAAGMLPADITSLTRFRNGVAGPRDSEVANRWLAFLPSSLPPAIQPSIWPNDGQTFAQVVHTDGVTVSLLFKRPKPAGPPDELPRMGKQEGAVNPLAHLHADWLGCDPGKTNMATVAHEERYPSGAVESVWQRSLTAGQYYRQSGITQHAKRYREYVAMTLVTWPAMWAELSKPRWSNARFRLYRYKQSTVAKFWAETVRGAMVRCNSAATGRPLALAYGAAGFSGAGSRGSKGVPVKQMLREACQQFPGRVLMVHEFRNSRVSSARTNVVAGHAEGFSHHQHLNTKHGLAILQMCSTSNGIRFYDRDVSAALNIRRIAAGPGRPRELSSWVGRPAMPNPGRQARSGCACATEACKGWQRQWVIQQEQEVKGAKPESPMDARPQLSTGARVPRVCSGALVILRARSEVVEARLVTQIEAWVEACSKRALLASLLLGLMVRDSFTRVTALADGQELLEEIPADDAVIPDFAERNLYLQLGRGVPPPGLHSRPSAAVEDVLTAYPTLSDELNVVPRYPHDCNTVDDVGQKLETSFANSLTELFKRRVGQAVALAGARVIAGSHEHQRRFGLPVDGSPAWTERQRSWVVHRAEGLSAEPADGAEVYCALTAGPCRFTTASVRRCSQPCWGRRQPEFDAPQATPGAGSAPGGLGPPQPHVAAVASSEVFALRWDDLLVAKGRLALALRCPTTSASRSAAASVGWAHDYCELGQAQLDVCDDPVLLEALLGGACLLLALPLHAPGASPPLSRVGCSLGSAAWLTPPPHGPGASSAPHPPPPALSGAPAWADTKLQGAGEGGLAGSGAGSSPGRRRRGPGAPLHAAAHLLHRLAASITHPHPHPPPHPLRQHNWQQGEKQGQGLGSAAGDAPQRTAHPPPDPPPPANPPARASFDAGSVCGSVCSSSSSEGSQASSSSGGWQLPGAPPASPWVRLPGDRPQAAGGRGEGGELQAAAGAALSAASRVGAAGPSGVLVLSCWLQAQGLGHPPAVPPREGAPSSLPPELQPGMSLDARWLPPSSCLHSPLAHLYCQPCACLLRLRLISARGLRSAAAAAPHLPDTAAGPPEPAPACAPCAWWQQQQQRGGVGPGSGCRGQCRAGWQGQQGPRTWRGQWPAPERQAGQGCRGPDGALPQPCPYPPHPPRLSRGQGCRAPPPCPPPRWLLPLQPGRTSATTSTPAAVPRAWWQQPPARALGTAGRGAGRGPDPACPPHRPAPRP